MNKVALVLEGGGMRGAFTAGVLDWMLEQALPVSVVVGISSGAMYGAFYVGKMREILAKTSIEIAPDKNNVGLRAFLKEGQIVAYNKMYDHDLYEVGFDPQKIIDNTDQQLQIGVYSMSRYQTEFKNNQDVAQCPQWIKAACCLPVYSHQIEINGEKYLDGGITTMIPIGQAKKSGANRFIVVTTKSPDYIRPPFKKWQLWLLRHVIYRKHRPMVDHFSQRTEVYYQERQEVDRLVNEQLAVNLFPSIETGVSRYKGTRAQFEQLFELGRQECEKKRNQILALFK